MGKTRGFSLAEMMIVIAIIIIIATMLFIFFAHARDDAAVTGCEMNEQRIAEAIESYAVDHQGQLPPSGGTVNSAIFGGPGNPYFNNDSLVDPASGLPYIYIAGPGMCQNPDAEYQIIDQGGHSSFSLAALLAGDNQQDSVAFCSDRGLYAMQSTGGGGASATKPQN